MLPGSSSSLTSPRTLDPDWCLWDDAQFERFPKSAVSRRGCRPVRHWHAIRVPVVRRANHFSRESGGLVCPWAEEFLLLLSQAAFWL
jgi:hypothetical protein